MTHQVTADRSAGPFWEANADSLLGHESEACLMIGFTLGVLASGSAPSGASFFTVRQGTHVVGQAVHSGGGAPLLVTRMSEGAAHALAAAIVENELAPSGFRGPAATSEFCARAYARLCGGQVRLSQRQGLNELREVIWPSAEGGTLVCGTHAQHQLALAWVDGFVRECFPEEPEPTVRAEGIVARHLGAGHLYFWKTPGGDLVSMAGRVRETPHAASISLVYVPPEQRGFGYAQSVVAQLSQHCLDRGKEACNLYTDLNNPVSNKAYVRVGYVQLLESHTYTHEDLCRARASGERLASTAMKTKDKARGCFGVVLPP